MQEDWCGDGEGGDEAEWYKWSRWIWWLIMINNDWFIFIIYMFLIEIELMILHNNQSNYKYWVIIYYLKSINFICYLLKSIYNTSLVHTN